MLIENTPEHARCPYHSNSDKPLIKIHKFAPGNSFDDTLTDTLMVFVMEGEMHFNMGNYHDRKACKGDFLLAPAGWSIRINMDSDCVIMAFRLLGKTSFCECYTIENLYSEGDQRSDCSVRTQTNTITDLQGQELPYIPKINTQIWSYLQGLYSVMTDGLKCRNYLDVKIKELLHLLRAFYPKDQLNELFHPVASADTLFSDYVRANHRKHKTVAQLAASLNMSHSGFARKFVKIFRQSPYQWMMDQKADAMYAEVVQGAKTLKQIATDYGFTSPAHFNDFCKEKWGKTPGAFKKDSMAK